VRVLVAMSGGVDSSVAALLLVEAGHEVVGATMKLWGGPSDSGCCSVADVDDARAVADRLGIVHHVFNFSADFERDVVAPYVGAHRDGITPNPCIECNRHLKFDRLLTRADQLGFDALATGHHARVVSEGGRAALLRGRDRSKDQSYVLHMLDQAALSRLLLPVGELTKDQVRRRAEAAGLRTAAKPDSQDVCFISRTGGRGGFLGERIPLRPGRVVDEAGRHLGEVPAVELVTVGQRRGLGLAGAATPGERRYAVAVDLDAAVVTVGDLRALQVREIPLERPSWVDGPPGADEPLAVQCSAHGDAVPARWDPARSCVRTDIPVRRVAPGQSAVLYRADAVVGGGVVSGGVVSGVVAGGGVAGGGVAGGGAVAAR
jgi:tRNA-specific 2-thiouridylase